MDLSKRFVFKRNKLNITESSDNASFQNNSSLSKAAKKAPAATATKQTEDEDEELNMWLAGGDIADKASNKSTVSMDSDCSAANESSLFVQPEV
jgi:hypothetical protein